MEVLFFTKYLISSTYFNAEGKTHKPYVTTLLHLKILSNKVHVAPWILEYLSAPQLHMGLLHIKS